MIHLFQLQLGGRAKPNIGGKLRGATTPCYFWRNVSLSVPNIYVTEFFYEWSTVEKLCLCQKIPHEKSYLNIFNNNGDVDDLRFLVFNSAGLSYPFFGDVHLTVSSFVHKNSKWTF